MCRRVCMLDEYDLGNPETFTVPRKSAYGLRRVPSLIDPGLWDVTIYYNK